MFRWSRNCAKAADGELKLICILVHAIAFERKVFFETPHILIQRETQFQRTLKQLEREQTDTQTDTHTHGTTTVTLAHARRGLIGERERANLVVQLARIFYIIYPHVPSGLSIITGVGRQRPPIATFYTDLFPNSGFPPNLRIQHDLAQFQCFEHQVTERLCLLL